jgi:predicted nuclease with TOPRIM domain
LEVKAKNLEAEHEQKDNELSNLQARAKELEESLETAEANLKQATSE